MQVIGVRTMGPRGTEHSEAGVGATGSSHTGGIGSQQVLCVTTPLKEGIDDTEGPIGNENNWVAGMAGKYS